MPVYDYRCPTCKHEFEKFYSLEDYAKKPQPICPECMGFKARRVLTIGGVHCDDETNVRWLKDARDVLQDSDEIAAGIEKPITSRGEWRNYLKQHNIVEAC
jgi:putative FmdB family regulatory protein